MFTYLNKSISIDVLQTYIPLQSFNVERPKDLPLLTSVKRSRKYNIDSLGKHYPKQYIEVPAPYEGSNFPVLKIEEDFDDIPMTNGTCKTISTQTSPVNELTSVGKIHKKGSSNSLWTSDESILRSGEIIDEDTKSSSSSSACEETGGVISSGKSGKYHAQNKISSIFLAENKQKHRSHKIWLRWPNLLWYLLFSLKNNTNS